MARIEADGTPGVLAGRTFGRAVDYLGVLGKTLRDLSGFATLAHELIQNAEDARASWARFSVEPDALVVDNDGVFTDCGALDEPECPWRTEEERGHRCDFHRFRIVAGADKREEAGTVGAFGIGFTAVYQVTDYPHLISAGRHWVVDETQAEHERIRQCAGCSECQRDALPGTRFRLPWAKDPQSGLRQRLRAEAVRADIVEFLTQELGAVLPAAMLFLRGLRKIELVRNGEVLQRLEREEVDEKIVLVGGLGDRVWHLVRGDFDDVAMTLKERHPGRIESKRTSQVQIAIPEDLKVPGVLCAFLPTQHLTGLPFHVQADFFPTSDRKRIILEPGYQADWNTAALRTAARLLASALEPLKQTLDAVSLWELASAVHVVGQEAKRGERDAVLAEFWSALLPSIRSATSVLTTSGVWRVPCEALLLERAEEEASEATLTGLELPLVDLGLRPFFGLLRSGEIGVRLLDVPHVTEAIRRAGAVSPMDPEEVHALFGSPLFLEEVWGELRRLVPRPRREPDREFVRREIEQCPIVPCLDGLWRAGEDTYWAGPDAVAACRGTGLDLPFASQPEALGDLARPYCAEFDARCLVDELEQALEADPPLDISAEGARAALTWFHAEHARWSEDRSIKSRVRGLPLFPTARGLRPLTELSLPGNFDDPLGLAEVVDLSQMSGLRDFLIVLGARELTLSEYAERHLPRAFGDEALTSDERQRAVQLLAGRLGEIRDNSAIKAALQRLSLVECTDAIWRQPDEVYLPSELVRTILGNRASVAAVPVAHQGAVTTLYEWLGVAASPRPEDVLRHLEAGEADPADPAARTGVAAIVRYLSGAWKDAAVEEAALRRLSSRQWLPARSDCTRWYRPDELYASFQEHLFASTGTFLDVPPLVQRDASDFLQRLGVHASPTAALVVTHLLKSAASDIPVNAQVFVFLKDAITDADELLVRRLRAHSFIPLPAGGYLPASKVFWGAHPFGRWRASLGTELRPVQPLFDRVGIRESPDARDAIAVLRDLAAEFGTANRTLDEESRVVALECWRLLSAALQNGSVPLADLEQLSAEKVVPGPRGILEHPKALFFEDRTGLAQRFPRLRGSTIARPEGAWPAMATAGVRSLTRTVRVHLVECEGELRDEELRQRLDTRRAGLRRVLASDEAWGAWNTGDLDRLLDALRCVQAETLVICFEIDAFGRPDQSDPESTTAVFLREEQALYRLSRSSDRGWAAVARELARALDADGERIGTLAAGIREVLSAESEQGAADLLDELGYAPVTEIPPGQAGQEIRTLGTDDGPAGECGNVEEVSPWPHPEADAPANSANSASSHPSGVTRPASRAHHSRTGGASDDSSTPPGSDESQLGGGPGFNARAGPSNSSPERKPEQMRPQAKLRSYVSSGLPSESAVRSDRDEERTALDRAGVDLVLTYERESGRLPTEMSHTNPGYDVESRNESGEIVRYIEVKSTGTPWGSRGVALSNVQYDFAREHGDEFWLYVVCCPGEESAEMFRIQNPAERVTQYAFDDGWRHIADHGEPG